MRNELILPPCWRTTVADMLVHTKRFAAGVTEACRQMCPRDAERFERQIQWLTRRLEDAQTTVSEADINAVYDVLADVAAQTWRLKQITQRVLMHMSLLDQEPFANGYRWYIRQMEAALSDLAVEAVDLKGETYNLGLPVKALNAHEWDGEALRVAQMVEPVIMVQGSVWRMGSVMLEAESL